MLNQPFVSDYIYKFSYEIPFRVQTPLKISEDEKHYSFYRTCLSLDIPHLSKLCWVCLNAEGPRITMETTTEEMTEEKQPPEGEEPKKKKRLKVIRRFGKDFMDFIRKYKVLGMAVAFIMATYVGLLVQALVDDIIMPLFTYIPGLNNLDRLNDWVVGNFYIGHFLSTSITFIAVAFVIYLIIKIGTKLGAEVEE